MTAPDAITEPALTIRLPLPPTTNNIYIIVNGRKALSKEARIYKQSAGWLTKAAMQQPGAWPLAPPFDVTLCHYSDGRSRPDAGNVEKLAVDAVFGALGKNDKTITRLHILMMVDRDNPRLDVVVRTAGEG